MPRASAVGPVLAAVIGAVNVSTMTGCVSGKTVVVTGDWSQSAASPACVVTVDTEDVRLLETMGRGASSVLVSLHLFSDYDGQAEIQAMANAAVTLLDRVTLSVSGWTFVSCAAELGYDAGVEELDGGSKRQHFVYPFRVDVKATA